MWNHIVTWILNKDILWFLIDIWIKLKITIFNRFMLNKIACSLQNLKETIDLYLRIAEVSKVSRIRRETHGHGIQPMHTLTRHISYFSRREITRIAPTNLRPGHALFLRHTEFQNRPGFYWSLIHVDTEFALCPSWSFTNELGYALPYSVLIALHWWKWVGGVVK